MTSVVPTAKRLIRPFSSLAAVAALLDRKTDRGVSGRAGVRRYHLRLTIGAADQQMFPVLGTATVLVIALGTMLRVVPVLQVGFPFGDGGLYYAYIKDLTANHLVPPAVASYNGGLDFPYPFLAFELVALISSVLRIDPLVVMRFLPPLLSSASLLAFAWLARLALRRSGPAFLATLVFALLPEGYVNSILGGGITKALVTLLVLLSLAVALVAYRSGRPRGYLLAGLLVGLAQLSHPSGGLVCSVGLLFLLLREGPTRRRVAGYVGIGVVAISVSAAWWLPVLVRDGPGPFLSAAGGGRVPILAFIGQLRVVVLLSGSPVFGLAVLLAATEAVVRRSWALAFLAAWWVAVSVLDERDSYMSAPVPFALFAAAGAWSFGASMLVTLPEVVSSWLVRLRPAAAPVAVIVIAVSFAVPLISPGSTGPRDPLREPDLTAIRAADSQLAPGTRVLLITGASWRVDDVGEWFPALSRDISVVTPQGTEWQNAGTFGDLVTAHDHAQECATAKLACIEGWSRTSGVTFDAIYVAGPEAESSRQPEPTLPELFGVASSPRSDCCKPLRDSVLAAPGWRVVYQGPGALIALRIGGSSIAGRLRVEVNR